MLTTKEFIESGILEQYVLGIATAEECMEVEQRATNDFTIQEELKAIELAMENYAMANAVAPNPIIKPFLMATIDYTERLQNGEPISHPPLLSQQSSISDYAPWLQRSDMVVPINTNDVFAKIIGYTPEAITAIVWLKDYAPNEVHDNEHERFFIVEGTCDIIVEGKSHSLQPGDYFAIPLHNNHMVKVTSNMPCKVILQRVAA
jgi:mannose-6-phosphate isomerase-like protein (cupin superfamily)